MTSGVEWQELTRRLADIIADDGVLRDPAWRAALRDVPRHVFVPRFFTQRPGGEWRETNADSDRWLDAVYQNEPLVTALAATSTGSLVTVSSSTKPGLMIRMLEALEVGDGHRLLEIGTGTGYNAGLLTHRLGPERVFSVDIGAALVAQARERLPHDLSFGFRGQGTNGPEWAVVSARDGSWCAVCMTPEDGGARQVRQGGPVALWDEFERSHQEWLVLDHPDWARLGLTVFPDGAHRVWLDEPDGAHGWRLSPCGAAPRDPGAGSGSARTPTGGSAAQ